MNRTILVPIDISDSELTQRVISVSVQRGPY